MSALRFLLLVLGLVAGTAQAQAPAPVFRDCPVCPEMISVPAGTFVMGEDGPRPETRPAHPVTLDRPFALGRTEVTFDQWQACVAAGACPGGQDDHGWGRGSRPMINVTHADAQAYARWLSALTGHVYRLPLEAEWEYAARAGTTTPWWFGDTLSPGWVNCLHCVTEPWKDHASAPVASYPANPWGFFDMHGNVWEWVADCWTPDHQTPAGPGPCRDGTIRGGAWYHIKAVSQSASRARNPLPVWSYIVGFRVLREIP
ncbi:formylglycine-generating enzyme family protein [Pararhodospirillum photometricum]|nr:formylglycine-generating enzyme family protein [Pararhodospirillum photometricum]